MINNNLLNKEIEITLIKICNFEVINFIKYFCPILETTIIKKI